MTCPLAGLIVFVARPKTDQEGLGDFVGIANGHPPATCTATCPIRAWREWQAALSKAAGGELPEDSPAFRPITRHGRLGTPADGGDRHARLTGQSVALIVKQAIALLDDRDRFPPARYAGHSLRRLRHPSRGRRCPAGSHPAPDPPLQRRGRAALSARGLWRNNPSAALGL